MEPVPNEIEALRAALAEARAEAAAANARASNTEAAIASLELEILKLRRELYGRRPERKARLLERMELELEELAASAGEDELAAEQAAAATTAVPGPGVHAPAAEPPAVPSASSRSQRICRASAWRSRHPRPVPAAARPGWSGSART